MLDRLLGRRSLNERIEELESELDAVREERDSLQRQLEAESGRRADAQSARQEAERRINRLEDRIADLEGTVERLRTDERALEFRDTERIGGERTAAVLDRLASFDAGAEGALTAAVGNGVPDVVAEAFGPRAPLVERAAPCVAVTDDAGLVSAALAPPVGPDPFVEWGEGFALQREWFLPSGEFALALVRADVFALGEYDGTERTAYTGFESAVKGDHSKGGFSQARFERRRDDQIDAHLERCRAAMADSDAERLYVVGDRAAVAEFEDLATGTAAVDATGDPEDALDRAFRSFWTTKLFLI